MHFSPISSTVLHFDSRGGFGYVRRHSVLLLVLSNSLLHMIQSPWALTKVWIKAMLALSPPPPTGHFSVLNAQALTRWNTVGETLMSHAIQGCSVKWVCVNIVMMVSLFFVCVSKTLPTKWASYVNLSVDFKGERTAICLKIAVLLTWLPQELMVICNFKFSKVKRECHQTPLSMLRGPLSVC